MYFDESIRSGMVNGECDVWWLRKIVISFLYFQQTVPPIFPVLALPLSPS